jgi:mannose-6-phosphate isomerase-like protein (cupin superfamily)
VSEQTEYSPVLPDQIRVLPDDESCPELPIVDQAGQAWAVAWPGVGAHLRSMHRISLDGEGSTVVLRHPMESVYYVIEGSAIATDIDEAVDHELEPGAMILIDPGTRYRLAANGDGAEIVGGPCPPDPGMYTHLVDG